MTDQSLSPSHSILVARAQMDLELTTLQPQAPKACVLPPRPGRPHPHRALLDFSGGRAEGQLGSFQAPEGTGL